MPICFVAKRSSLFSKDRHPKNVHVSENSDISSSKQSVESTAQISVPFEGKNGSVSTSPSFGSGNSKGSGESFLRFLTQSVKDFLKKDGENASVPSRKASGDDVSRIQGMAGDIDAGGPVTVTKPSLWSKLMIRKPELIKGSEAHNAGYCFPCRFFFKGRCQAGLACEYCHLCTKGDVRRRNKQKKRKTDAAAAALEPNWETKYNQARVDALNASWPEKYDQAAVDALNGSWPAVDAQAAVDALNASWPTKDAQAAMDALNASCPAIGADAAVDALNTSWATI